MKLLNLTGLILIVFLSACDPMKYVAVPVEYSPRVLFRPDSTSILLVNQFDLSHLNINNKKKLDVMKAGIIASARYAQTQLKQLANVKVTNLIDTVSLKINTDSVKTLASTYHTNFVLALHNFNSDIDLTDFQSSTLTYASNVDVSFILYESNGVYSKQLNGSVNEPQSEKPNIGLIGNLILQPTMGKNRAAIVKSSEHATQIALQDYLPYTITHMRPLYNDDWLQPAVREIFAGHFEKADTLLQPFLTDKNLQIASKAAYNLAVVYESEGDVNLAVDLAKQSSAKYRNRYAEAILEDLKDE